MRPPGMYDEVVITGYGFASPTGAIITALPDARHPTTFRIAAEDGAIYDISSAGWGETILLKDDDNA